ncbi:Chromosome partition protein Smc [compost metagenome]
MRPAEYTTEQVIAAGLSLQNAGRNITAFALRKAVGGGEARRLKQVWDEYLAGQAKVEAVPVAELPIEVAEELEAVSRALVEQLQRLAVELNDKTVKAAERRVTEVVRAAGEQREQAERELADASLAVEELEDLLEQSQARGDNLAGQLATSEKARQALEVELAQLRERSAQAEKAHDQAAKKASQRETALQAELEKVTQAERVAREREAQTAGALQAAEKRQAEDAAQLKQLQAEVRAQGDQLATGKAERERLAQDLAIQLETVKTQKATLTTQGKQLSEARDAAIAIESRAQVAEARAEVLQASLDKLPARK